MPYSFCYICGLVQVVLKNYGLRQFLYQATDKSMYMPNFVITTIVTCDHYILTLKIVSIAVTMQR